MTELWFERRERDRVYRAHVARVAVDAVVWRDDRVRAPGPALVAKPANDIERAEAIAIAHWREHG
jgi:hypothetical protein